MGVGDLLRKMFSPANAVPPDAPRLSGASESALGSSLQSLPAGERGWITLAEAARLFSSERPDYAFGEMDDAGKVRLGAVLHAASLLAAVHADGRARVFHARCVGDLTESLRQACFSARAEPAMQRRRIVDLSARAALAILAAALLRPSPSVAQSVSLAPSTMPRIGSVSERYQSYNVEMIEVTGGRFWKPYGTEPDAAGPQPAPAAGTQGADAPAGMNADLYQYRPPIDLDNARLRKLAAALGPAYVRVSGTWANTTYFSATDPPPAAPPAGFKGVLSRAQWKGVVDFARAVNAQIVTSFATGAGTRDAAGVWTAEQAARLVDYTSAIGGRIAAAEFMNEPNLAVMGGAPAGYDAAAYGRDFKRFHAFARAAAPDMLILGPGSVGETADESGPADGSSLTTRNLLTASRPAAVDAVSYHHYGALSRRCAAMGAQTTA